MNLNIILVQTSERPAPRPTALPLFVLLNSQRCRRHKSKTGTHGRAKQKGFRFKRPFPATSTRKKNLPHSINNYESLPYIYI